ncbi:hypothetical protein [Spirosoma sp. 48-14]|uniref:hypothetical protein n=1 Tax=Spirosoma sp. 48-14 TaxID=1895854 RepID=UPI000966952A|nr:hypothetical protein [Spirosoma sp. 48-14]OJW78460.1 MAG: hypothetical protein BGO59_31140 [Spirosoma sp. 48-14]
MPTADQNIYVRRSSDHVTVWSGKTLRNTDNYPLTTQGQALFEAAVLAGNHSGITASNGGTVAAGVAPTLTIPNPPVQGYAAYDVKIQAETAASNVNFSGTPGDVTTREFFQNSSHYADFAFTGMPVSDGNYTIILRAKTTSGTDTTIVDLIINNGTPFQVSIPPTGGGLTTVTVSGKAFQAGDNTLRFRGNTNNAGLDYIRITHPASA